MLVKICGITTKEAAICALENGADFLGFVFYGTSPRNITARGAADICASLERKVKTVAVTVDANDNFLRELLEIFKPDYLQLHGNESPERANEIKTLSNLMIIKALSVASNENPIDLKAKAQSYYGIANMLLFDAKPAKGEIPGGNARSFNWEVLQSMKLDLPWFLSGGLSASNIVEATKISGAKAIDVSSGVETVRGIKDIELIKEFLQTAKTI